MEREHLTEYYGAPSYKRVIRLTPSIGDWTTLRPPKVAGKRVKTGLYGFDRLSEGELNLAHLIHYRFVEALSSSLRARLEVGLQLYSISVEQIPYLDFIRQTTQSIVQSKIPLAKPSQMVTLYLDLSLANSLINRALGSRDLIPLNRGLTEVEEEVLLTLLSGELPTFSEAWRGTLEADGLLIGASPQVAVDPSLNPTDTFIVFTAELAVSDSPPAKLSVGYTQKNLKNLLENFISFYPAEGLNLSRLPSPLLDQILIPVEASLGETTLKTEELYGLTAGDGVLLKTKIDNPLPIKIGMMEFLGRVGIKSQHWVIRLLKPKLPEEEKKIPLETGEEAAAPPAEALEPEEEPAPAEEKVEYPPEEYTSEYSPEENFSFEEEEKL